MVLTNRKTSHPAGISSTDFSLPSFNGATEVGTFCGQAFGAGNKEQLGEIVAVVEFWAMKQLGPRFVV